MTQNDPATAPLPEYADNMFIEALPPILPLKQLQASFDRPPLFSPEDPFRPPEKRLHTVLRLMRYSQPTVAARELGRRIEQMIYQGYIGRNPNKSDWMRFAQVCGMREAAVKAERPAATPRAPGDVLAVLSPVEDTSISTLVAGPPGVGKTHAVATALMRYPQIVYHTAPFVLAQIVWLRVECPPNGSLVSLCRYFFAAVDTALNRAGVESNLGQQYKTSSLAVLLVGMARVANLHGIGLLVIDEIQHVRISNSEGSALLNFLVTLRNAIGIPLLMVGTMSALSVVQRTFRDARRADGLGSIIFNRLGGAEPGEGTTAEDGGQDAGEAACVAPVYGKEFEGFVRRMWRWQYTNVRSELSVPLLNAFYEETQGVIDLIVKLFVLVQMHLINVGAASRDAVEEITADLVREIAGRSFNSVRPFIRALRDNDQEAIAEFEDLVDLNEWFANYVAGAGMAELEPINDPDHGVPALPPMAVAGAIDASIADAMLDGMDVAPERRSAVIARHAKLVEAGDVSGFVAAVRRDLVAHEARDAVKPSKRGKTAKALPIDDDLRQVLEGAADPVEAAARIEPRDLASALE